MGKRRRRKCNGYYRMLRIFSLDEISTLMGSVQMDILGINDSDTNSASESNSDRKESKSQHQFTKSVSNPRGVWDEKGIPLLEIEDLTDSEIADLIPHQRLTINNKIALSKAQRSITLSAPELPFSDHQTVFSVEEIFIRDINDDLSRELAFYKQSLDAVSKARTLLMNEGVPFSRPTDYFAEMVKSDEHMGKIKKKITEEAANKKAAADARKQRDLKKFGKQVQIAKLQERDKSKRETLDKINILKRSEFLRYSYLHIMFANIKYHPWIERRTTTNTAAAQEEDLFDIALEDVTKLDRSGKLANNTSDEQTHGKRRKKDHKFGFGGKKRFAKSGDATSSADLRGFSSRKTKRQKTSTQRLGKNRRAKNP